MTIYSLINPKGNQFRISMNQLRGVCFSDQGDKKLRDCRNLQRARLDREGGRDERMRRRETLLHLRNPKRVVGSLAERLQWGSKGLRRV